MELKHDFTVPAPVEETWTAFNDLEMVAGCFPGASLTSVEGDDFTGSCKVKLGPISLVYSGSGTFLERDGEAHRFVLEAKGKDKRGNGTAGALVTAVLTPDGPDATRASVTTDLAITGKPAQFGRGVIQDVSDKLLRQFVGCLESKVGGGAETPAEPVTAAPAGPVTAAPVETTAGTIAGTAGGAAAGAAEALGQSPVTAARDVGEPPEAVAPSQAEAERASPATEEAGRHRGGDDALDLGATVLPILLRTYWRQVAGTLLVVLVLRRLLGRRR